MSNVSNLSSGKSLPVLALAFCLHMPSAHAQAVLQRVTPTPGTQANADSTAVDISANGRVLVFQSSATNWTGAATNNQSKIVWVDLANSDVRVISTLADNTTALISGNSDPAVSQNGQYVAFVTTATNAPFAGASGQRLVRKNIFSGELVLVSASSAGTPALGSSGGQAEAPNISDDGRFVSFSSDANNLVSGDSPQTTDVFVKDLSTNQIDLITQTTSSGFSNGVDFNTSTGMSADGNLVVFEAGGPGFVAGVTTSIVQVYLRNRATGSTELISRTPTGLPASNNSGPSAISANGRFVSFRSSASNLIPGSSNVQRIFVLDRSLNSMSEIALPQLDGAPAARCDSSAVADDATVILTCSNFSNRQVFVRRPGGVVQLLSQNASGTQGNAQATAEVTLNANAQAFAFVSPASNLVPNDTNAFLDVFYQVDPALLSGLFANGFE